MPDPLTADELAGIEWRAYAFRRLTNLYSRRVASADLDALLGEVKRLRAKPPEDWPHLANESRARLYAACVAAGVDPEDKWLSESALEAIAALQQQNLALAERCHGQSEALSKRAEK